MKIGIDARSLVSANKAGIATYLDAVLACLGRKDQENEYILYSWQPFEVDRNYGKNFSFRLVPATRGLLWSILVLSKVVKEDGLDVFWGPAHELPLLTKKVKSVLTVHDLALLINPRWGNKRHALAINLLMPDSVRRANIILADSQSTKQDLMKMCHAKEKKIHTVYLGGYEDQRHLVSAESLAATREKYSVGQRYFFFVGTIEPRKNIETVVKAFELVAAKDSEVQLILAGALGWRYDRIVTAMESSLYKDRIKHIGFISKQEKLDLYVGAQAFLFPSHYEGFGLPVLETMSLGGLVITAANSSLPEVGGEAALYVENENDEIALAAMMEQILTMGQVERNARIEMGLAQAAKFSWEKCAEETSRILMGTMGE